jgi:hypothetical protein
VSFYRRKKKTRVAPKARTKEEKCATPWCRNRKAARVTRHVNAAGKVIVYHGFHPICWKCHSRLLKERHPWTYALNGIRGSARKRGLPCTLTVAEFKAWCLKNKYIEKTGNKPGSMTVDRIDWNEGYHIWNIQPLTHAENSEQGVDNTPREERMAETELVTEEKPPTENEPF